jgi:hypothetical protein
MTKNFLFWCNLDMIEFGISYSLQKKIDGNFYAISDSHDSLKNFFQDQDLVNFKKTWYYRDYLKSNFSKPDMEYLKSFEQKYKISIWGIVYSEILFFNKIRYYVFSDEEILSIIEHECKLFEKILSEVKPDCIFINYFSGHHAFLFCKMCESLGIEILMHSITRIGYRVTITSHFDALDIFDAPFPTQSNSNRSVEELQNWFKKYNLQKHLKEEKVRYVNRVTFYKKIKASLKYLQIISSGNYNKFWGNYGVNIFNAIKRHICLKYKKWQINRFLKTKFYKNFDPSENYVYFPLHAEPERSLSLGAPLQPNQFELIILIAKSLPLGYKFFVKDHPYMFMFEGRDLTFFKKLLDLPNVYLLPPELDSKKYIENASLVFTVNGTSALESAFFGVPSIVFGKTGYSFLPSVETVTNLDELPKIIQMSLEKYIDIKDTNLFVDYMEQNSIELDYRMLEFNFFSELYNGGFFGHDDISVNQVQRLLNENKSLLNALADEHVKKLSNDGK